MIVRPSSTPYLPSLDRAPINGDADRRARHAMKRQFDELGLALVAVLCFCLRPP